VRIESVLKGVAIKPLKRLNDERGSFTEVLRVDWKDLLGEDRPAQANFSTTYPGMIRAWHRHLRGQTDYFIVLKGALKICAYDEETKELDEIVSTGQDPQIVRMPGSYWHGYKALGNETAFLLYFVTRLYDHQNPDEERKPWNDQTITPKSINGKKDDPRTSKPWDWNYPPYR
jgi:dTDP-4-dehydrorhamnose 3,5-epimerase